MNYTYEIIQLLAWPVMIYITYRISMKLIDRFEAKHADTEEPSEKREK